MAMARRARRGLAVAIPVVAVLGRLERRVDRTAEAMESIVTGGLRQDRLEVVLPVQFALQ
jgi:hypothetical protein